MATPTFSDLKMWLKAHFGDHEDSSGTVDGLVSQLVRKTLHYNFPAPIKIAARAGIVGPTVGAAAATAYQLCGQSGSLSASQPLADRVIFIADKKCKVIEADFCQLFSSTLSATLTNSWTLILQKRGKGSGTFSLGTGTATTFIGGLTSASTAHTFTYSYSHITQNRAGVPNKLLLNKTAPTTKLQLQRGDQLWLKVRKGSGHADDTGCQFYGGSLKVIIEEN